MNSKISKKLANGFATLLATMLILSVVMVITVGIGFFALSQIRITRNIISSAQSHYIAEAGIEDSLYRIVKEKNYEASNTLVVGEGMATISISSEGDNIVIKSEGDVQDRVRSLETTLTIDTTKLDFYYGAQVDRGGIKIKVNASVIGNVYSNGNITGVSKGSTPAITGDAWVAGGVEPTADQEWTIQDSDFPFGIKVGNEYFLDTAQSFIPSQSKVLNIVSLYIKKEGSLSDQTVVILADDNGQPSQTSLASGTLSSSKVTTSYSWIDVSLDSPPNLIAGTTYWIVIDVSRDNDNYWIWGKDSSDAYPLGEGKYAKDWESPGKQGWKDVGGDLNFKIWMGGVITYIDRIWVGVDAHTNAITNSWIDGDAYYQTIDEATTVGGTKYPASPDPPTKNLPISYAQIQDWEQAAEAGGVISGDYEALEGSSLGPIKIEGNLTFPSNSIEAPVTITGPIWVTGKILAINNVHIRIQEGVSFGYPIIADNPDDQVNDGQIEFNNNVTTEDSSEGGCLLFISTNKSLDAENSAIWLHNNINKDSAQSIIFSLYGLIKVENNAKFKEITGYAIYLENNAEIVYESGLINADFSSGPGGGWRVLSWKEIP